MVDSKKYTDRDEFVATLAREIPDMAPHHVADLAGTILRVGKQASRAAVNLCNGDIDQDEFDRVQRRLTKKIEAALTHYADLGYLKGKMPTIGFRIGGDPRGYVLKLRLPSKRHNTWGGEEAGYGVPSS